MAAPRLAGCCGCVLHWNDRVLLALQLAFHHARDCYKADHAVRIFENQAGALPIHHGGDQVAIRFRNSALRGLFVIAIELSFFHAGDADEADDAVFVFEDEAGSDAIGDGGDEAAIRLWDDAVIRRCGLDDVRRLKMDSEEASGEEQEGDGEDKDRLSCNVNRHWDHLEQDFTRTACGWLNFSR